MVQNPVAGEDVPEFFRHFFGEMPRAFRAQSVTPDLASGLKLPEAKGALVSQVLSSSPGEKAGLKPGDVITDFNGHAIAKASDLPRLVSGTPVGSKVPVTVLRDGRTLTFTAEVAQMPESEPVAAARKTVTKFTHGAGTRDVPGSSPSGDGA